MPDAWHCECGYTNLASKTCLVCRRPRQAVPPPRPEPVDEPDLEPAPAAKPAAKRPLKARATTKKAPRKRR